MSSILISTDDQKLGEEVAQKVADSLNYTYIGRPFLKEVTKLYNVDERQLLASLDEPPSSRAVSSKNRNLSVSFVKAAVLDQLLEDNIVCTGLAAHLYARDVAHFVTVRVLANYVVRTNELAASQNISLRRARKKLEQETEAKVRWSEKFFELNETNPGLYDMVLNMNQFDSDLVVELIARAAQHRKFSPMTYSLKCAEDLAIAAKVQATLMARYPEIRVCADGNTISVHAKAGKRNKHEKISSIKELARAISGVDHVEVHIENGTSRTPVVKPTAAKTA